MSLEAKVEALTAAIVALTSALNGRVQTSTQSPAAAVPAGIPSTPAAQSAAESSPKVDYPTLKRGITEYQIKNGKEKTLALLAEFGVRSGLELKPEQWADVFKRVA